VRCWAQGPPGCCSTPDKWRLCRACLLCRSHLSCLGWGSHGHWLSRFSAAWRRRFVQRDFRSRMLCERYRFAPGLCSRSQRVWRPSQLLQTQRPSTSDIEHLCVAARFMSYRSDTLSSNSAVAPGMRRSLGGSHGSLARRTRFEKWITHGAGRPSGAQAVGGSGR